MDISERDKYEKLCTDDCYQCDIAGTMGVFECQRRRAALYEDEEEDIAERQVMAMQGTGLLIVFVICSLALLATFIKLVSLFV